MHYQSDSHSYYNADSGTSDWVARLVSSGAVVIFSKSTCYMCHAAKSLFCDMGVSPIIFELDQDPRGRDIEFALSQMLSGGAGLSAVPTVFIGGKLVGSMDSVVAAHIAGTLVPLLREAGALWL